MLPEPIERIRHYRWISPRLGTAGQPDAVQFTSIRDAGYRVVINLALTSSDNALPNEGSLVAALGLAYVHIPVDFTRPTASDFQAFAGVMDAFRDRRAFVHCALNMRASAFVFLHRVLRGEATEAVAREDLLAIWTPDPCWARFIADGLAGRLWSAAEG